MYVVIDSKLQICDKSFSKTPQGYLQLEAIIARSGKQDYLAHELGIFDGDPNRIIVLDRPAEHVTDAASIASFLSMPVTDEHPREGQVNPNNFSALVKGTVLDAEPTPSNQVKAKMIIHDAGLIKKIEDGKRELSAGYTAEIVFSDDGKTAVQKRIRGNHVAFVDAARCGKECSIFDSKPITPVEVINMAKMKIKGVEYEVADSLVSPITAVIEDNTTLAQSLSDSQAEVSSVTALKDAAEEKVKAVEDEEEGMEKKVEDAANKRVAVLTSASKLVKDFDGTGKTVQAIKREVVATVLKDHDFKDRDDAYMSTRFDILCEDGAKNGNTTLSDALGEQVGDKVIDVNDKVAVARAAKIKRTQDAYLPPKQA